MSTDEISVAPPPQTPSAPRAVAPIWHTVLFLLIIFALSALSAHSQAQMVSKHGRVLMYLTTLVSEWILVGYVIWGLRLRRLRLRDIVGGRWQTPEDFLLDLAIAVGFWITATLVLVGISYALGLTHPGQIEQAKKQIGALLPRGALEMVIWVALSVTAGFCEEIMFRGYLQSQFAALTRNAFAAVVLQAAVFGVGHAYQGDRRIVLIACYGFFFGLLAWWRRSLRPGMIGHALQDTFSGLMSRAIR